MHVSKNKLFDARRFQRQIAETKETVSIFRGAVDHGRAQLRGLHESGASSPTLLVHHAWLIDQVLEHAWEQHRGLLGKGKVALVAVGGYGRGELHPYSDIDLMILLGKGQYVEVKPFVETFLSFLWDIGLEVGHSVRSVSDCVREARKDITVATNLMEARLIEGDESIFVRMKQNTGPAKIWKPGEFFVSKLEEQRLRHLKYDDTAYDLEPNIKEGPGGLRDIQTVAWVLQRRYGCTDLEEYVDIGYLTKDEMQQLIRGRNFLWKLRSGLHYVAGRGEDRLLFQHQRELALQYGYKDNKNHLAVEQLMKRYYRTVKELRIINEILLQHYQDENNAARNAQPTVINDRFQSRNEFLETRSSKVFQNRPSAILELFLILQQNPSLKGVRASTIRLLRANLMRIDAKFRRSVEAKELFMTIMREPSGQTHALRRMNNYGVLGVYIPVFGAVVGQMQHDLFHVYTVDAHSLFVVRNLRRFAMDEHKNEMPMANAIMAKIGKPERLYLAGLFHDIAKGRGGDHSVLGETDALKFCKLHNMSDYDARLVAWLVRRHLLMSYVAQRQDITDPEVVRQFAETVGDLEHLNNLYLLTIADMRGTSPFVWNAWKGRLLENLYHAATRYIRYGLDATKDSVERIRDIKNDVLAQVRQAGGGSERLAIAMDMVKRFWASLPPDYFLRYDAMDLIWHLKSIFAARAVELPMVRIRSDQRLEALVFLIYAPESETLLSVVTGGFERLKLNIADAKTHRTETGFALYTFVAIEQASEESLDPRHLEHLQHQLEEIILANRADLPAKPVRLTRKQKQFWFEPQVSFSQSSAGTHTVMEVIAMDQPGLLHRVSKSLLNCKVRLVTAKIATLGERAEDVFFITDRDGNPVSDQTQLDRLRTDILANLSIPRQIEDNRIKMHAGG